MTAPCRCWRPTAPHEPDCARGREEAAAREREHEAAERLFREAFDFTGTENVVIDTGTEPMGGWEPRS